jgi:hypothetical protein
MSAGRNWLNCSVLVRTRSGRLPRVRVGEWARSRIGRIAEKPVKCVVVGMGLWPVGEVGGRVAFGGMPTDVSAVDGHDPPPRRTAGNAPGSGRIVKVPRGHV